MSAMQENHGESGATGQSAEVVDVWAGRVLWVFWSQGRFSLTGSADGKRARLVNTKTLKIALEAEMPPFTRRLSLID